MEHVVWDYLSAKWQLRPMAEKLGLKVKVMAKELQSIASIANPIDMMATASGAEFGASLKALVDDPGIDAAVVCFMTPFFVDTLAIAAAIEEQAARTDKTLIAVAMTNPDENPEWRQTVDRVRAAGVPVYYFPEMAARVLHDMDRGSYGDLVDVGPLGDVGEELLAHKVWRYGIAFPVPARIPGGEEEGT